MLRPFSSHKVVQIKCRETGGRIVTLIFSNEQNQQECVLLQNTSHMLTYFVVPELEVVGVLRACTCYIAAHTCLTIDSLTLLGTDLAYILIALPSKLIAMPIIMKSVRFSIMILS